MKNFPVLSDLEQQEERTLNIIPCLHAARRGTWATRRNFLKQMSLDATQLKWKGWASELLMFRQQSLVVGLRKVLNMSKEFKMYVQTQERNTGISQDRHNHSSLRSDLKKAQASLSWHLLTFAQFEDPTLFNLQWEPLPLAPCEEVPHL